MTRTDWYPQAGAYLEAWQRARTITEQGGRIQMFWNTNPLDVNGLHREMQGAIDRRINAKGNIEGAGRKLDQDYQVQLGRDRRAIEAKLNDRVVLEYIGTPELKRRYAHLIVNRREDY